MEFLAEDNAAGQNLLQIVARGSSIVAELLRLSDHIPSVFLGNDPVEVEKYKFILLDFRYLKSSELYDEKIDNDMDLVELDEEFRETHFALLERFYKLFDSIYKYQSDFRTYLEDLMEGVYVQHTVEGVLLDIEGKQLMCEALYLYGVMLLIMDRRVPGATRERMIVSYYRYKGGAAVNNIDEVCKLCHSTGYSSNPKAKRLPDYPESYFNRFPFPRSVVAMIIGRLRSDDVYNRNEAFPSPDHRSTALATQAAMLYVILFFQPDILHKKQAIMREIVDKHFNDNWVITYYMGFTVDLSYEWEPYKAAKLALMNILEKSNVLDIVQRHKELLHSLSAGLKKYLVKGTLVEEYVLDNLRKLLQHVRNCNVTLRWHILHRTTTHRKYAELIQKCVTEEDLLGMMMDTAQFEFQLKELFTKLIDEKQMRWEESQKEASERMLELSEYFSGQKALTRVEKNDKLQTWFKQLSEEIKNLEYSNATMAGRKIARLHSALEEVEEFHQIETSIQVKTFLQDTRTYLTKMIRTVNIKQQVLGDLDIISDFSYGWLIVWNYTQHIHRQIKQNPNIVLLLRATFLKLASILSLPLVRITQAESNDAVSVAEYYSSELVRYVRHVLEIIPRSVFQLLDGITQLQTHHLKPFPMKLERLHLREFAQLELRHKLASSTHQVSVFTDGILAMKTTLVGIIKLDPKQLLQDGVRKQLVQQICHAMNDHLVFKTGGLADFEKRILSLGKRLEGFKQSFEYIQDYIGVYGLKIWQQEFSRIINYYVEQESNTFLKKKVYDWQSTYQSDAIPIPQFPRPQTKSKMQNESVNFMGRLMRELLSQSNPRNTIFVEANQGWYGREGKETIGIRTFDLLNRGVGVIGLTGLDRLISFMIVRDLQLFVRNYRRLVGAKLKKLMNAVATELHPTNKFPANPLQLYTSALKQTSRLWSTFLSQVTHIGQAQLLRRMITNELNFSCKLDSKLLSVSLTSMNDALLNDVLAHYAKPDTKPYPGNPVLPELTTFLEHAGINDPITKIYITSEPLDSFPLMMFLFVLAELQSMRWSTPLNTLVNDQKKSREPLDGAPFVVGIITILKQFHSTHTSTFLAYMGQFVRSLISENSGKGAASVFPAHVQLVLHFLEEFCRFATFSREIIEEYIPSYIFDHFSS